MIVLVRPWKWRIGQVRLGLWVARRGDTVITGPTWGDVMRAVRGSTVCPNGRRTYQWALYGELDDDRGES